VKIISYIVDIIERRQSTFNNPTKDPFQDQNQQAYLSTLIQFAEISHTISTDSTIGGVLGILRGSKRSVIEVPDY
jgi:hypothetical protein